MHAPSASVHHARSAGPHCSSGLRAILDKNVRIPEDARIGYDLEADRRSFYVTESGIVVIAGERSSVDVSTMVI